MVKLETRAPAFTLLDQNNQMVTLDDYSGKWLILYFYPRDNTPGCTTEALGFTAAINEFNDLNAEVVGISPDSVESHCKFIEKRQLDVRLLSDPDHIALENYSVWQLKRMCGREYHGVIRSTYIVNPDGIVVAGWEKVRVKNHVETVLKTLKELQADQ